MGCLRAKPEPSIPFYTGKFYYFHLFSSVLAHGGSANELFWMEISAFVVNLEKSLPQDKQADSALSLASTCNPLITRGFQKTALFRHFFSFTWASRFPSKTHQCYNLMPTDRNICRVQLSSVQHWGRWLDGSFCSCFNSLIQIFH